MTHKKTTHFSSDNQLLAELGERLIATPQIALAELVKNAYDADATRVNVWLTDKGKTLNVKDDGNGMSEAEFVNAWMRIASSHKAEEENSRRYRRLLTGSKGVGRFAVRFLGKHLLLESSPNGRTGLRAEFPWATFSAGSEIGTHPITYWTDLADTPKGTWLKITGLRHQWTLEALRNVSGEVLELQAPFLAATRKTQRERRADPGFQVHVAPPGDEEEAVDTTREILDRAAITLDLQVRANTVRYTYSFRSRRKPVKFSYRIKGTNLIGTLEADIRFLPKRPGAFAGLENHDGRSAAAWVRRNGGVKVFDRGFRVPPYGSQDDDWLKLSVSVAARRRSWDSFITEELLPAPDKTPTDRLHPALHLPANHQLIGFVSAKTPNLLKVPEAERGLLLQPSMDRQGFVPNEGFTQLYHVVRAGMELLASLDLDEELRRKREAEKKAASSLRESIRTAIVEVESNEDIPVGVRHSIGSRLRDVAEHAQRSDLAREEAEHAVEALGLLGVVAAFMTHEMTTMLRMVKLMLGALDKVNRGPLPDPDSFARALSTSRAAEEALERHIEYVQRFAANTRARKTTPFKARPAAAEIVRQFDYFTAPRSIFVELEVDKTLAAPAIPMSVYSGILLNLYTNALKAVLAKKDGTDRRIRINASASNGSHMLLVEDSGVGVSSAIRDRIFEPLFSTTDDEGPLGPGMGFGLYIVQRVAKSFKGRVRLVDATPGYQTAFEVRLPNGK